MKTVTISAQSSDLKALLEQARQEDLIVQTPDGEVFMLTAVDDFDWEIARTRQSAKLMTLLEARAQQPATVPLADVPRQLGLDDAAPTE